MTKPEKTQTRRARRGERAPEPARVARRARKSKLIVAETAPQAVALAPLPPTELAPLVRPSGKLGVVVDLLRRPQGARVDELMTATGWQSHTVRGAMSGALKGRLKLAVTSESTDAGRIYRITDEVSA